MLRVGLTGGVASGKSSLARLLAARGAAVRDADDIVAEIYRPGGIGVAAVTALFGEDVLDAQGAVDRSRLASLALGDETSRRRLELAIHPRVRAAIGAWFTSLAGSADPPPVAVLEAALLVETGSWRDYDRLVVVTAPLEVRRARALAAGWSADRFERIVDAQATDEERAAVADHVVDNGGDEVALAGRADALWRALLAEAAAG